MLDRVLTIVLFFRVIHAHIHLIASKSSFLHSLLHVSFHFTRLLESPEFPIQAYGRSSAYDVLVVTRLEGLSEPLVVSNR